MSGCASLSMALLLALVGVVRAAAPIRIMAVGDSITEGHEPQFMAYRYPLAAKLAAAGYAVKFVGTKTSPSPLGPLPHEGYSGKDAEFLVETVPAHFRDHPADVVLLHAGHNHDAKDHPVAGIVAANEALIQAFRATNPRVTVLLAEVIPSGKLPKYSYIPELNQALAQLATRLSTPAQRVIIVDQVAGFNWATDTIADKVHPNALGTEKMAATWFLALRRILPKP